MWTVTRIGSNNNAVRVGLGHVAQMRPLQQDISEKEIVSVVVFLVAVRESDSEHIILKTLLLSSYVVMAKERHCARLVPEQMRSNIILNSYRKGGDGPGEPHHVQWCLIDG